MTVERYGIGTLAGGAGAISSLEEAGITQEPRGLWSEGEIVELADGSSRAVGYPVVTWIWDYIREESRTALRAFCAGTSERVYIQTLNMEGEAVICDAMMRWPRTENVQAGWPRSVRWNFEIEFLVLKLETL